MAISSRDELLFLLYACCNCLPLYHWCTTKPPPHPFHPIRATSPRRRPCPNPPSTMKRLTIDPSTSGLPTKDHVGTKPFPEAKTTRVHPSNAKEEDTNATLYFIGTATTLLEWEGIRILTDPNFLHAGDHVHLGPGVSGTRQTNPAIDIEELPRIDAVLLSHYHEDHFDRLVEDKLKRELPIITTPHAYGCLTGKGKESFTSVHALDFFESLVLDVVGR